MVALASLLLTPLASIHAAEAQPAGPGRPNTLFALADDWSYGQAGAYRCPWVKTPAFDRVAKKGILFTELKAHGDPRTFGKGHVFDE
jgi:N-sulfoglucosamine sulfohydrolase